ncbi:DUF6734 family protein [Algoriphagus sp.]|uniref:DUF6734 family protein n=1 Tax=Algoriphagus sp. TaxID=1872435 RepID=UPI00391880F3
MKIVHTFWIDEGKNPLKDSFGWCSAPYHLMSWALSCLQLHQFYEDLELITDRKGKVLLIDQLQLPYKKVRIELDDVGLVQIPGLWVMKKIYSYTRHEEAFLNVDGDVFVYAPFPKELLSGKLIAQNIEQDFDYYKELVELVGDSFPFVPKPIKEQIDNRKEIQASNAGILGGNEYGFFKRYYQVAEEFINRNHEQINSLSSMQIGNFNQLVEQYMFHCLSNGQGLKVSYLLGPVYDPSYLEAFGNFHHLPAKSAYIHTLGDYKKSGWVCDQLAHRLRLDYPEYFARVMGLFEKDGIASYEKTVPDASAGLPITIQRFTSNYLSEPETEQFYRTNQVLSSICEKEGISVDRDKFTISELKGYLGGKLTDELTLRVLDDVYEFEQEKLRLIRSLYEKNSEMEAGFPPIQSANQVLKNKCWQEMAELKLASYCKSILSEWDWSQNSVLFTRVKINNIENNLLLPPHFFQTILLWDRHHQEVIEYLLGPIESYLLSILKEDDYTSMSELVDKVSTFFELVDEKQILEMMDEEIRFLAYSGVIILREIVDT